MTYNIETIRQDFPILSTTMNGRRLAFLDTAASAQKPRAVIDAMTRVYEAGYSNIHRGLYKISQNLTEEFEGVRKKVAVFINAPSESNVIFTRNTTESINLVASSWGGVHLKPGDEIILSAMEHHANIVPWQLLKEKNGIKIKVIPLNEEKSLDLAAFEKLLSRRTRLVSVVAISNALGTVNDINKIIKLTRNFNPTIKILVDGSQAVVHGAVDVAALDCDFYVFTGHKLYGPTGIGVLYGKADILESMPPYQGGGDMIETVSFAHTTFKKPPARFEAGTPAIAEVIGLGAAIDYVCTLGIKNIAAHEQALLQFATDQLAAVPDLTIHGPASPKAGILSFTMDGAHSSDIGMVLDQTGVAVRTGHHCCMPLMAALGLDSTVRASIGLYTDKNDIIQLVESLNKARSLLS